MRRSIRESILAVAAASSLASGAVSAQSASDSAAVVDVVERFHKALSVADSGAALALLSDDVLILESGGVETRDAYRSGHLRADIAFAQAVPGTRTVTRVAVVGNAAWVASTSVTQGTFRDRQINSAGAELMILRREAAGWRIVAVHWSSRTRR